MGNKLQLTLIKIYLRRARIPTLVSRCLYNLESGQSVGAFIKISAFWETQRTKMDNLRFLMLPLDTLTLEMFFKVILKYCADWHTQSYPMAVPK